MSYNEAVSIEQRFRNLEVQLDLLERRLTQLPQPHFQDLADAELYAITDGQVPMYDQASGLYKPGDVGGGGGCTNVYGAYDIAQDGGSPVVREIVLEDQATLAVTVHVWGPTESAGGVGAITAYVGAPMPSGVSGTAISVPNGSDHAWTGSMSYVASLSAGTYNVGATWASADAEFIFMAVTIVVGCYTGDQTVSSGV